MRACVCAGLTYIIQSIGITSVQSPEGSVLSESYTVATSAQFLCRSLVNKIKITLSWVLRSVRTAIGYLQVLDSVIQLVVILVMNDLFRGQLSSEMDLHNMSML